MFLIIGLTFKSIRRIVTKCPGLVEINVKATHLQEYAISSMCRHLPPKLQKLCLSNLNVTNEHVRSLTLKCPNLSELDLSGTQITYSAVPYITENLSQRSSSSHVFENSETTNLLTCSWHQKTNLKCCIMAKEPFKTPLSGVLFLISYFLRNIF